jgi:hypothetical protein
LPDGRAVQMICREYRLNVRRSNSKGNLAPRIQLLWILVWIPTLAAFGQQAAKELSNPAESVQNAISYNDRGVAKQKKGDLDGAMADFNQAIGLREFMRKELNATMSVRRLPAGAKDNIGANGIRLGLEQCSGARRLPVSMHPHMAEILTGVRLHPLANS